MFGAIPKCLWPLCRFSSLAMPLCPEMLRGLGSAREISMQARLDMGVLIVGSIWSPIDWVQQTTVLDGKPLTASLVEGCDPLLLVLQGPVEDLLCTRAIQESEVIGVQLLVPLEEGVLDFGDKRLLFLGLLFGECHTV